MPINYKEYHPKWKLISKFIRFYRAKNRCEKCGVPNHIEILRGEYNGLKVYQDMDGNIYDEKTSQYLTDGYVGVVAIDERKVTKVVLTVAHLNHDKKNNSFFNLKALCQKCHLHHDKDHHARNRKFGRYHKKNQYELRL